MPGVSPETMGNLSFSVNYHVLDPNDKAIFGERDYAKSSGTMPKAPAFIMGDPALDLILEDSDPEGGIYYCGAGNKLSGRQESA